MKTKHTPGPWIVEDDYAILSSSGDYIASVRDNPANAALMATAPDLLAERDRLKAANAELVDALEALLHARIIYDGGGDEKSIDDAGQSTTEPLAIQARAAIAKARPA